MPTITVRLSDVEKRELVRDAHVSGLTASDLVREALGLRSEAVGLGGRVEDLERRLLRLERMAGVD